MPLRRWSLRLARSLLFIYLSVILVLSLLQNWLIFPGAATQGRPDAIVHPRPDQELVRLHTATNQTVYALWTPAPQPDAPTVLFFYGNAMCAADTDDIIRKFTALGCNVLVPDFVGYGMSTGKPSESELYATADAAYDHLVTRPGVDKSKIIAAGWSLGAGVATDLATRRPCAALLTFCAFTNLPDVAARIAPFFPARLMLHHRFDNLAKFPTLKCPIFCAHGKRDSIIPVTMTERLAAAAHVTPFLVGEADHNDFFDAGGDALTDRLREFLATLQSQTQETESEF